jgi:transcriptional regulator with XRE-family HTH domain
VTTLEPGLAPALRYLRLRAQLTQQAVCDAVRASGGEISMIYLSMLERGQRNPSPQMLDRLLVALDSDRDELAQLHRQHPWATARMTADSSSPRMRPQPPLPPASTAAPWSNDVTLAPPRASYTALNEIAELWPRIPRSYQRELVRLARRYAER